MFQPQSYHNLMHKLSVNLLLNSDMMYNSYRLWSGWSGQRSMTGCSPSCWWSPCSRCPPRRRTPRCTPPRICPAPPRLPEVTRMFCPHPDVSNYLLEGGDVVPRVGWWIINALEQDRSLGDQQRLVGLQFFCLRRELEKLEHLGQRHKVVTCVTKCHEHHIVTRPCNETFIHTFAPMAV